MISERNAALLEWFDTNRRDLPWRVTTDPYPILVSEVMLQQTQVTRVIPRFISFIDEWPNISSLAMVGTDALLRIWSGLGYNSRALRLRETARIVMSDGWPDSIDGLRTLPGVGQYTAAAVGSISFGFEVPAVDTNLKRVLSRWAGEPLSGQDLESFAADALATPAGDWNQALMDLGSAVCTRRDPMCGLCPVAKWCQDPTVYQAPRRQSRFNGSRRQLRGALVQAHLSGASLQEAGESLNRSDSEIERAIESLCREGLVVAGDDPLIADC